jgi:hypothetical protein
MRRVNIGTALAAGVALTFGAAASRPAQASTVLDVAPGPGSVLDQGALCLTSSALCPGNATDLNLQSAPYPTVSGSFVYTPTSATSGTMSFTLTLTSSAAFGSQTMLSGSTFTASNIDVTESVSGTTESISQVAQTGSAIGSNASMTFSSGLPVLEHTPAITDLNCQFTPSGGLCGVSLGGSLASGLQFGPDPGNGGANYNGFLTFDTTITPVPLPPSFWLMLGGLGCFGLMRRPTRSAMSANRP